MKIMIKNSFNLFQKHSLVQSSKLQRSKYLQKKYEQNDGTNISLIPKKMVLKLLILMQWVKPILVNQNQ